MRTRRVLIVAALLLGPTACGRGCACFEGEKTYETLDGKVKVELVRKTRWAGGRIPGPISKFAIRVHTKPSFDEPVSCMKVDLAEDREGKNVAFRCKGAEHWTVLRLRGGGRRLRECEAPVGAGRKPDLTHLPPVRESTSRMIFCSAPGGQTAAHVIEEIARSITEDDGDTAAAHAIAVLADSALEPAHGGRGDPWQAGFAALSPAGREAAHRELCGALVRVDVSPLAYRRAAARCAHEGAAANALTLVRQWFPDAESTPSRTAGAEARARAQKAAALRWAVAIALRGARAEAGALGCELGARAPGAVSRGLAATLVAQAGARCDGILSWRSKLLCGDVDCDGGLCQAAEVAERLRSYVPTDDLNDAGARSDPVPPAESMALLGALYAQGPLPRAVTVPNARIHYKVEPPEGGARCSDELRRGTPCACGAPARSLACSLREDQTRGAHGVCNFHIDDAHARIDEVTCACIEANEPCRRGGRCCGGLRCDARDSGACVPRPAPPTRREAGAPADEQPAPARP